MLKTWGQASSTGPEHASVDPFVLVVALLSYGERVPPNFPLGQMPMDFL